MNRTNSKTKIPTDDLESLMERLHNGQGEKDDKRSSVSILTRSRFIVGIPHLLGFVILGMVLFWFSSELIPNGDESNKLGNGGGKSSTEVQKDVVPPPTDTKKDDTPIIIKDNDTKDVKRDDLPWPKIAWLLSFPNSGTSYTTEYVRKTTTYNTGSNYGNENLDSNGQSVPIHPELSPNGPFWNDPTNPKFNTPPTSGYVLTKTHCGGYCDTCRPEKYTLTPSLFTKECQRSTLVDKKGEKYQTVHYDTDIIAKVVHLIRNPYDNIVARFHLTYKHFLRDGDKKQAEKYPSSKEGFRKFCTDLGRTQYTMERRSQFVDDDVLDLLKDVPCHADFIRYVQWHNYAILTSEELNVPTMILHYEKYTTDYEETTTKLLEFLEQEKKGTPPKFVTGKEYREYYTREEREKIRKAVKKMSSRETWELLKHYFEE